MAAAAAEVNDGNHRVKAQLITAVVPVFLMRLLVFHTLDIVSLHQKLWSRT